MDTATQTTPAAPAAVDIDAQARLLKQARRAIAHTLNAICNDPATYFLLGEGTETYAQLTAAHAALHGASVEDIRRTFRPEPKRYDRYCRQLEINERLLQHCREQGITVEEEA